MKQLGLTELRRSLDLTQREIAQKLRCGQDSVSRVERRGDVKLSTLQAYIEALGGRLSLTVTLPDRQQIELVGFAERGQG